jgi:hypothetical protein
MAQRIRQITLCIGLLLMTGGGICVYGLWPNAEPAALGTMLAGVVLVLATRRRSRRPSRRTGGEPDPLLDLGGYPMSMLRSGRFITRR